MIAPAPVIVTGELVRLDVNFVEGMRLQQAHWPSRITCLLRRGAAAIPFGRDCDRSELPFDLRILDHDEAFDARHLEGGDMIYARGDDFNCLGLVDHLKSGQKIVYVIDYTDETRRQIIDLDRNRGLMGRIKGRIWLMKREKKRRRAFRAADALQSNGYPAHDLYSPMCRDSILYLDGRMTSDLFATEAEMAAREAYLSGGGPLRLLYSGRLEAMKGAQDLVPVARRLAEKGVDFTLDIFGTGSLEAEVSNQIKSLPDPSRVRMNGAVDFETRLVPFTRQHADVFLGCHRQADPSCAYIEAMGCGVAVASDDNRMWQRLNGESRAGWGAALGDVAGLADQIARVAQDQAAIIQAARNGWQFSQKHGFLPEFQMRMEHLARVAGVSLRPVA